MVSMVTNNILNQVDALILCGGLGTRLKQVTQGSQKVMVDFNGEPFLNTIIGYLKREGVTRMILCTGHGSEDVERYYRNFDDDLIIDYSREEKPLGTGGAIKSAQEIVQSDCFFVLNGDSVCREDLHKVLDFHLEKDALATVVVSKAEDMSDYGEVVFNDDSKILEFKEKQNTDCSGYVNAGIYCFHYDVFDMMPQTEVFSLEKDFFITILNQEFYAYKSEKNFTDIGTPERLDDARKNLS